MACLIGLMTGGVLFTQVVGDVDGLVLVVAFEDRFGVGGDGAAGKQPDEGNEDQSAHHGEDAGVDGIAEHEGEQAAAGNIELTEGNEQLHYLHAAAPYKGCCNGCGSDLSAVEAVEEGSQEGTGKSAPGYAHHLSNENILVLHLIDSDCCRNDDEHNDENSHDEQLLLFGHILAGQGKEEVQRNG